MSLGFNVDYAYRIVETVEGPRYVLHDGEEPIGAPLEEVSVCFDKESGVLHKHGALDSVTAWFNKSRQKLSDAGFQDMANELTVVTGPIPLEELNRMISTSGYCGRYFKRMGMN